jgi:hypothetical protein
MLNEDDNLTLKAKGIMLKQSDSTFDQSIFNENLLRPQDISHLHYKNVYENNEIVSVMQSTFRSFNHQIKTVHTCKVALTCFDDKRAWIAKNKSFAYGHYKLNDPYINYSL